MSFFSNSRARWTTWFVVVGGFICFTVLPVSNTLTRTGGIVTLLTGWILLTGMIWRRRWLRALLVATSICFAALLILPSRSHQQAELLRQDFVAGLRHYEGVRYFWGGEGFTGIDCSGLVRRGLIDSLFVRGVRSLDGKLIRYAFWLWWNDCSASDLGDGQNHLTIQVCDAPSINALDHSRLVRGDLAVTKGGEHVMAYSGDNLWIEADPLAHRVITVSAPSPSNAWFHGPIRIVRWSILSQ